MIIFNSPMTVANIKIQKKVTTTYIHLFDTFDTKRIKKYSTTQFQTQALNVDYRDLQNALSHALYLILKCSLQWAGLITGEDL